MSKYIIELDENAKEVVVISLEDGDMWTETMEVEDLEQLNSDYINEHFGDLQDTAYQRGLEDAWEAAKKIFGYEIDGGIPIDKIGRVFGYSENETFCTADIIRHNTASEAIAKLKAYEEKQKQDDKIEVGDEVVDSSGEKGLVVSDDNKCSDTIWLLINGYRVPQSVCKEDYTKTGRHFDIEKILEAMKHD